MDQTVVGRILWRAAEDENFRSRALQNLGTTLAEEGFVVDDAEMSVLRGCWEGLGSLSVRKSRERIQAMARTYKRER